MSLLNAKRIADLTEQVDTESKKLVQKHAGLRKGITDEVSNAFAAHMEKHGFDVSKTAQGLKASYKGLVLELKPANEEEVYIGCYHSFILLVDGKEKFIRVVPKFTGGKTEHPPLQADKIEGLEHQLAQIDIGLNHLLIESYKLDCSQPVKNQRVQPDLKDSIDEVLDVFLA